MKSVFRSVLFTLLLVCANATNAASIYSTLYFLGDSLMDTGSLVSPGSFLNPSYTSPPYAPGRFSNGPTWVETFAGDLGFPVIWGVNNFAVGGAVSADLTSTSTIGQLIHGGSQTDAVLAASPGGVDPNALYVIGMGGNDFLNAPGGISPAALADSILDNIEAGIQTLQAFGAQHFLLMNSPDISVSSSFSNAERPGVRATAQLFNAEMNNRFGADHLIFDSLGFIDSLMPTLLDAGGNVGISPGTEGARVCLSDPGCNPAGDTSAYLLFDSVHPTREVHEALGHAVAAAVVIPLPAPFILLLSSLCIVLTRTRSAAT